MRLAAPEALPPVGFVAWILAFSERLVREAVVPDFDKTDGEHVDEESADELVCRDNDGSVACGTMIVSGFEYHPAVGQIRDAAIGDGTRWV